eukprot:TCONS_00034722-protein
MLIIFRMNFLHHFLIHFYFIHRQHIFAASADDGFFPDPVIREVIQHHKSNAFSIVTIKYIKFIKGTRGYISAAKLGRGCSKNGLNRVDCPGRCMDYNSCISWSFTGTSCICFETVPRASPRKSVFSSGWRIYELKNPCTENLNLCEHGSICSPHRLTKTYDCINCLPPYSGKHCNESDTLPPSINLPLHEDILFGRNISCRMMRNYFTMPNHLIDVWIHPWRDHRKIKVTCEGRYMTVSFIHTNQNVNELNSTNLTDGLDLTHGGGENRAHTSFLQALENVIQFDQIHFQCRQQSTGLKATLKSMLTTTNAHFNVLDYFIGKSNTSPKVKMMDKSTDIFDGSWDLVGGSASDVSGALDIEERTFKNIGLAINGYNITFGSNVQ